MRFTLLPRVDGRVELVCSHGVGHVSQTLTEAGGVKWESWMGVHGCDGCCGQAEFRATELKYAQANKLGRRVAQAIQGDSERGDGEKSGGG